MTSAFLLTGVAAPPSSHDSCCHSNVLSKQSSGSSMFVMRLLPVGGAGCGPGWGSTPLPMRYSLMLHPVAKCKPMWNWSPCWSAASSLDGSDICLQIDKLTQTLNSAKIQTYLPELKEGFITGPVTDVSTRDVNSWGEGHCKAACVQTACETMAAQK